MKRFRACLKYAAVCSCLWAAGCSSPNSPANTPPQPGATANGYFYFSSPTLNSSYAIGSTLTIRWIPGQVAAGTSVSIALYDSSRFVRYITTYATNGGTYSWYVSGVTPSRTYHVRIAANLDTTQNDFSCFFRIYSGYTGTISVTLPQAGASTKIDSTLSIQWVTTGSIGNYVKIDLYNDSTLVSTIVSSLSDVGAYSWYPVRSTLGTGSKYRIRVSSYSDATIFGQSQYFSIASAYSGSFAITSPDSNSTWAAGSSYSVRWTYTGSPGAYVNLQICNDTTVVASLYNYTTNSGTQVVTIPASMTTGSAYRIKVVSYYDQGVFGFSSKFTVAGIKPDAFEPDNHRDSASAIPVTGVVQARTLTYGDTDWVTFTGDSGAIYLIRNTGQAYSRELLYFGSETAALLSFYGGNSAGYASQKFVCTRSGTYYLKIYPYYTTSGLGDYQLSVTKYDSTTLASFSNPVANTIWATGSVYQISWTPDTTLYANYVTLSLYNGSQQILRISAYLANGGSYSLSVPAGLASGSNYRIRIANYSDASIAGYSAYFTISGMAPDAYEPDDSKSQAKAITVDGTVQSRSLTLGDTDWVSFAAQKNMAYVIKGSAATAVYMYLYSDAGAGYINYTSGYSPLLVWSCPAAGTYYLKIFSYSNYVSSYSLLVREYSPYATAAFINPTRNATWSAGSSYNVQWVPDTALFGSYVRLSLCRDTVPIQTITTSVSTLVGSYQFMPMAGLATDTNYRIRITSSLSGLITGLSDPFTISGIPQDPYEPDNSLAQAHAIAVNAQESHTLSYADTDWYSFTATAGYVYAITTSGSMYPKLDLLSGDGKSTLASANSSGIDSNAAMVWYCSQSQNCAFRVYGSRTGRYGITLAQYDSSQYRFVVSAPAAGAQVKLDSSVVISWSSQVAIGGNVDIFLYDNTGGVQTIAAGVPNTGSYSWVVSSAKFAAGGNRYIKVSSYYSSNIFGTSGLFSIVP